MTAYWNTEFFRRQPIPDEQQTLFAEFSVLVSELQELVFWHQNELEKDRLSYENNQRRASRFSWAILVCMTLVLGIAAFCQASWSLLLIPAALIGLLVLARDYRFGLLQIAHAHQKDYRNKAARLDQLIVFCAIAAKAGGKLDSVHMQELLQGWTAFRREVPMMPPEDPFPESAKLLDRMCSIISRVMEKAIELKSVSKSEEPAKGSVPSSDKKKVKAKSPNSHKASADSNATDAESTTLDSSKAY